MSHDGMNDRVTTIRSRHVRLPKSQKEARSQQAAIHDPDERCSVESRSFLPVARREFLRQSGLGLMGSAAFLASRQVAYAYPLDGVMGVQSADIRQQLHRISTAR